jgi:ubiquinone/menaquinone biosynthesis C-methylase UbiE
LAVDDESVDAVVCTIVLCSVRDLSATLGEIRRVLRPGGRFVFMEHVAAPRGTGLRRVQRLLRPVWQFLADGCTPDRETDAAIRAAGFSHVEIERFRLPREVSVLAGPHIAGEAVR